MRKSEELRAKAIAIDDKAKKEARELTAEETAEIDRLMAEAKAAEVEEQAEDAKKAKEDRDALLVAARKAAAAPKPRASAAASTVVKPAAGNAAGLLPEGTAVTSGLHALALDDDTFGFKSYNEFASVVKGMIVSGKPMDSRIDTMATIQGASTIVGEDGGFLIPPNFSNRMYARMMDTVPILQDVDRIVLTQGNEITITGTQDHDRNGTTYRYGGIVVYRVDEGDDLTLSRLKWRKVKIGLQKVGALSAATNEELSDVPGYGERLMNKMADAVGDYMVEDIMFGTGVGQPLGAFSSDACITQPAEGAQVADTFDYRNVFKMSDQLWTQSEKNAKFYYNREGRTQLRSMTVTVGTGGELTRLFERGAPGTESPDRLDGFPAYATEHCEALGDEGDLLLGDMTQYALVTKGTPEMATSMHLYFASMQQAFRVDLRYGGKPLWEQSLRPRKGAAAKRESPWVKLAERA